MDKPEYISLKDLCNEIEAASFSVKMRGYAPEEVDEFMDKIVERLRGVEEKLKELERYEQWLREDVHRQVMEKAQQEARQLLQGAQDKSRAMLDTAQAEVARERSKLSQSIQQYQGELAARRRDMEQELSELQQTAQDYRDQAVQALETALSALREDPPAPRRAATEVPPAEPFSPYTAPLSTPATTIPGTADGGSDIDRMLEELKRQIL